MERAVTIKVEKRDGLTIISNSNGKIWKVECNDAEMLISSLVGLTMAEYFRDREYLGKEIDMTLNVSVRV